MLEVTSPEPSLHDDVYQRRSTRATPVLMASSLSVSSRRASTAGRFALPVTLARMVSDGALRLEPGSDVSATHGALMEIDGVSDRIATTIVMRALYWPDAFPASDPALLRAARATSPNRLRAQAERWRPWRAHAALHLWLYHDES
jgi:AraC family transcriptional regulator of adaptative response / DNA-3-methyladenine glycosylase II